MENNSQFPLVLTDEFKEKLEAFKKDWYQFYKDISKTKTPEYDGSGLQLVRKRPDGLEYIIEAFMKDRLNCHFPGWSWKRTSPTQFLGSEWVVADGELYVIDERLLALGINPPYRYFGASGAARVMFKHGQPHTTENVVDIDKNVKAANTNAFKKAINQLLGIGDDVYGKRIEEEGAGSVEDIFATNPDFGHFKNLVLKYKISWDDVLKIAEIKELSEITNYAEAWMKIAIAKGITQRG